MQNANRSTFAEMAVALTLAASKLELDLAKSKMIAERIGLSKMGYELIVPGIERDVALVQEAALLLRNLSEIEPNVRSLMGRKATGSWLHRFQSAAAAAVF